MSKNTQRVRRSPAQWQQLVAEQADSGIAQSAFCHARGLSPSTFCHWKRKLGADSMVDEQPRLADFVELTAEVAPASEPAAGWDVELDLGAGMVLRLRRR